VYEKFGYASPERVEMLAGLIRGGLAGEAPSGVDFVLCEECTDPPEQLRQPGTSTIGLQIRVRDGEVHFTPTVIDGSEATKKLICDHGWATRCAVRCPDPKLRDQLIAEGLMRVEGEGDMSKLPAVWLTLDTTSLIRPRTAW
jgi:hypothetical protein